MCGLLGMVITQAPPTDAGWSEISEVAHILARSMSRRGTDSWGVCTHYESGEIAVRRGLGDVSHIDLGVAQIKGMQLHTRAATSGAVTVRNAHPFSVGDWIAAHNGCIWDDAGDDVLPYYDVDSEALLAHLSEGGSAQGWTGYGAIHWYDVGTTPTPYICRMDGGDLEVVTISGWDWQARCWVSRVYSDVRASLARLHVKMGPAWEPKEGQVYRIRGGKAKKQQLLGLQMAYTRKRDPRTRGHAGHVVSATEGRVTTYTWSEGMYAGEKEGADNCD